MVMQRYLLGTKSWNTPTFDIKDPSLVLYLPLWRQDMIARGGRIVSGTGTMAVTPLALVVGVNTITATGAGTFLVSIPEGGTVASGTATITTSPVTIPAGITTSVTTGVTTGNFTVTTNNIIRSKDRNNLACTVTGGVWGKYGWTADGDDVITVALASALEITDKLTVLNWVNGAAPVVESIISSKSENSLGEYRSWNMTAEAATGKFNVMVDKTGDASTRKRYSSSITTMDSTPHLVGFTFGSSTLSLYADGVLDPNPTKTEDTAVSSIFTNNTVPVRIGCEYATHADFFIGTIGEGWIFSRVLSASEILNIKLKTQWRYRS